MLRHVASAVPVAVQLGTQPSLNPLSSLTMSASEVSRRRIVALKASIPPAPAAPAARATKKGTAPVNRCRVMRKAIVAAGSAAPMISPNRYEFTISSLSLRAIVRMLGPSLTVTSRESRIRAGFTLGPPSRDADALHLLGQ